MDVTVLTRGPADWIRTRFYDPADRLAVDSLGFEITLAEIYDRVAEIMR